MDYIIKNVTTKQELEKALDLFRMVFKGKECVNNPVYSYDNWAEIMKNHSDLMLCACVNDEIIGIVFGCTKDNKKLTVSAVAIHPDYRKHGIAKEMMLLLEKRAKQHGVGYIDLGAEQSAENFYYRLGYTGSLLIQSEYHTIDQLLSLKTEHEVQYTNIYENYVNQLCLKMTEPDRALQKKYEAAFPGCHTMMMFWKNI